MRTGYPASPVMIAKSFNNLLKSNENPLQLSFRNSKDPSYIIVCLVRDFVSPRAIHSPIYWKIQPKGNIAAQMSAIFVLTKQRQKFKLKKRNKKEVVEFLLQSLNFPCNQNVQKNASQEYLGCFFLPYTGHKQQYSCGLVHGHRVICVNAIVVDCNQNPFASLSFADRKFAPLNATE